ncbi:MAG: glycine zipper 2TM domain-containing protein [Hyphomonadaceae bacterium]
MRGQVLAAASALAIALTAVAPTTAAAQQYPTYHDEHVANQQQCQQSRNNRTAGGAIIGGIVGALLGREVADRGVRGEGALLGAVVGATAGGAIGRNSAQCNGVPQGSYDPYNGQAYQYNQNDPYASDEDLYGGPYRDSGYRDDRDCRMGEIVTRDPYGREYREDAWMCRGADGVWRPE